MATTFPIHPIADEITQSEARTVSSIQATLKYMLGALAVIVGVDKFTNLIVDWQQYLNPLVLRIVPVSAKTFMYAVGFIEIVAGLIIFMRPRLGGFIMMGWLFAIAAQLVIWGMHLDVAARDIVMGLGAALTLARLTPYVAGKRMESPLD